MFRKIILWQSLLAALVFVAFQPALKNNFTNWDDPKYVTANPLIRNLGPEGVKEIFTTFHHGAYKPLVLLSFAVNYRLSGFTPLPYYAVNILLHCVNVLLVLGLLIRLGLDLRAAVVAAALFAVHPLRVESVAWITERKDLLFALFFLVSLRAYLSYLDRGKKLFLIFSLFAFLLSLISKPQGVTLPLFLLLIDYYRRRPNLRRVIAEKVPFLITAAFFLILNLIAWRNFVAGLSPGTENLLKAERIVIPAWGIGFYLLKTIFPFRLSAFYPYPQLNLTALVIAAFALPLVILVMLSFRRRDIFFGGAFFLLALAPVLQILPLGPAAVADRYTYIPTIGLFFIVGTAVSRSSRRPGFAGAQRIFLLVVAAGVIVSLVLASRVRCLVWRDSLALWNDVLEKYPDTDLALNNRGLAWAERGEWRRAIADYDRALELQPYSHHPYINRGNAWAALGYLELAREDFSRAIVLNPRAARAFANRGNIYQQLGMPAEAGADYIRALELVPRDPKTYFNRGLLHLDTGRPDLAQDDFTRVLELDPAADVYYYRGKAFLVLGDLPRAREDFNQALRLKPGWDLPRRALEVMGVSR